MRPDLRAAALLLVATVATVAHAQFGGDDRAWRDAEAPAPPPLRTSGLIPIDVAGSSLKFGVDPASIAISPEGIVRYVVVATSAQGAVNGLYEGIRCDPGMVRVFARYDPARGWVKSEGDWKPLLGSSAPVRHSLEIARLGACAANAPNGSAEQVARDLGASYDRRFRTESSR